MLQSSEPSQFAKSVEYRLDVHEDKTRWSSGSGGIWMIISDLVDPFGVMVEFESDEAAECVLRLPHTRWGLDDAIGLHGYLRWLDCEGTKRGGSTSRDTINPGPLCKERMVLWKDL